MKILKQLFTAAILLYAGHIQAQTLDEVVAKNVEAMGGKDKLASLKTVKMTGSMTVQGADVAMTLTRSQGVGMRMDIEVMGTSNYQLANTSKGSIFMPVMGMAAPQEMSEAEYKSASTQFDLQGPLLNYKEKGNTVQLAGTEKVDGADAYKIHVTFKNGRTATYFIDTKSNRIVKANTIESANGQDIPAEITYSDYKQNADGYWFPYTVTNSRGTVTYSTIDTNVKVDDAIFKD